MEQKFDSLRELDYILGLLSNSDDYVDLLPRFRTMIQNNYIIIKNMSNPKVMFDFIINLLKELENYTGRRDYDDHSYVFNYDIEFIGDDIDAADATEFYYFVFFYYLNYVSEDDAIQYALKHNMLNRYLIRFVDLTEPKRDEEEWIYDIIYNENERSEDDYEQLNVLLDNDTNLRLAHKIILVMSLYHHDDDVVMRLCNELFDRGWNPFIEIYINNRNNYYELSDTKEENSERMFIIDAIRHNNEEMVDIILREYERYNHDIENILSQEIDPNLANLIVEQLFDDD